MRIALIVLMLWALKPGGWTPLPALPQDLPSAGAAARPAVLPLTLAVSPAPIPAPASPAPALPAPTVQPEASQAHGLTASPAETASTQPTSNMRVITPEKKDPQPASDIEALERKMVEMVNRERLKVGLRALQPDPALTKLARMKSRDMAERGYFDHTSPTYGSPFEMMKKFGVSYRAAGENLASAPTIEWAFSSLMKSSGHRANILREGYDRIGIGVVRKGSQLLVTQLFITAR